jgi:hypothetical protein
MDERLTTSRLYAIWVNIKQRCNNPNCPNYRYYGGRGIKLCPPLIYSFKFIAYVNEHLGPEPSPRHTIDRINNNGNYEIGNLRWATMKEQNNNRRNNKTQ